MEYYNKLVCVTFEDLISDHIMKEGTLKSLLSRGRIQYARRGRGEGSPALIVYNSLPEKYRKVFENIYGNPEEEIKKAMMKDKVTLDGSARSWYEGFEYDLNGRQTRLEERLIEEYTLNASVLNELIRMMGERKALRAALGKGMGEVWSTILATSEELRATYPHTLPKNLARLKDKLNAYKKEGYGALISGKIGNQNTLKITEDAGRMLVALKRSKVPVYTDRQLFDKYNEVAPTYGWKVLRSLSGLKAWLNSAAIEPLWYDAVFGEQASRVRFDRRHHTKLPEQRDSLWYGDGTKLNLYYRGDDGKVYTTSAYEVIDAYSEVMLGYYISDNEDYISQYHAYRMAIQNSGHKPYEIVTDNQGGHKKNDSLGFFSKICHIHRPTSPYNGRSKTIENLFYRFQHNVLHKHFNFTGQNITTVKTSSRPNMEFIEANKGMLPTYNELLDIYAEARREWNEMPHPMTGIPRNEMYKQSVNEGTQKVTIYDMVDMFWYTTKNPVLFTASGIEITVNKQKHVYEVFSSPGIPDLEWRRTHTYEKFYVQYDPYDMTSIRLLTTDKRFARTAQPSIVIARCQQEQTSKDKLFIRSMQDAIIGERIERQVAARSIEKEYGMAPEQNGLVSPKLKGIPKEAQKQIERRLMKYSKKPEEYQTGKYEKAISQKDWTDQDVHIDIRKTASKL